MTFSMFLMKWNVRKKEKEEMSLFVTKKQMSFERFTSSDLNVGYITLWFTCDILPELQD